MIDRPGARSAPVSAADQQIGRDGSGPSAARDWSGDSADPGATPRPRPPARSLHDLILLGRKLDEMGIGLMSVQEKIDTSSSGGRLVFHMFGALAEFERNLVRERTQAGLNAARARGARMAGRRFWIPPSGSWWRSSMLRSSTRSARSAG